MTNDEAREYIKQRRGEGATGNIIVGELIDKGFKTRVGTPPSLSTLHYLLSAKSWALKKQKQKALKTSVHIYDEEPTEYRPKKISLSRQSMTARLL